MPILDKPITRAEYYASRYDLAKRKELEERKLAEESTVLSQTGEGQIVAKSVAPELQSEQERRTSSQIKSQLTSTKEGVIYQGRLIRPSDSIERIEQRSPYEPAYVTYASGKQETYKGAKFYDSYMLTPTTKTYPGYTPETQVAKPRTLYSGNLLNLGELKAESSKVSLRTESYNALKSGKGYGVAGGVVLSGLYFGTEASREFIRTPKYAFEWVSGYSFESKKQGIPIVSGSVEMVKSVKYLPQSFRMDPIGTGGRLTGSIVGFKTLGVISRSSGFSAMVGEAWATSQRSTSGSFGIPTMKDFYNVKYRNEPFLALDYKPRPVYSDKIIDIQKSPVTDIVPYSRVYVRPSSKSFKGFSEYRDINVPSGLRVNFADFSISKPVSRSRALRVESSYVEPLKLTKQENFIDLVSLSDEFKAGRFKPSVSEGIPKSLVSKRVKYDSWKYERRTDDLGNVFTQKDYFRQLRRQKSIRSEPFLDFRNVRKGRNEFVRQNFAIESTPKRTREFVRVPKVDDLGNVLSYKRSRVVSGSEGFVEIPRKDFLKSIRRTTPKSEPFLDITRFKQARSNLLMKSTTISSKSKFLRRSKTLRAEGVESLPTSAFYPFARYPKSASKVGIKTISPTSPVRPPSKPSFIESKSRTGTVQLLKPPKLKQKRKVRLIRPSVAVGEFKPSYQQARASAQYTQNVAILNEGAISSGSIPKYSFKERYVQDFAPSKLEYPSSVLVSKTYKESRESVSVRPLSFTRTSPSVVQKPFVSPISSTFQVQRPKQISRRIVSPITRTSPIQKPFTFQAQKPIQMQESRQIQRTRFRPVFRAPPMIKTRLRAKAPERQFRIFNIKSKSSFLNYRPSKKRLDILPSLGEVFKFEESGKEAIKPKKTKRIKRMFEAQYYGRDILGSPIPVFQKQRF